MPKAKAHVCLNESVLQNEIFSPSCSLPTVSPSTTSCWSCSIYSSSAAFTFGWSEGFLYMKTQKPIQTKPRAPITMKAISQPQAFASSGMVSGANSAPIEAPGSPTHASVAMPQRACMQAPIDQTPMAHR